MADDVIQTVQQNLMATPRRWLITGVAGFIGSNLLERLLSLNQEVIGLDNFATGKRENLDDVHRQCGAGTWRRFRFIEGDITDLASCKNACEGADFILHQAALASVPRSIADPISSHRTNVDGFVNILIAARDSKVRRVVYASSSAVYGDEPTLPKTEARIGKPLSPYALNKAVNEQYAEIFASCYGVPSIGLRYFNVFGRRQDPAGAYAAVIPKWIELLLEGKKCTINGDGSISRDFCYVDNVIQANVLAAVTENPRAINQAYNVACGARTTLNELFELLRDGLAPANPQLTTAKPFYAPFRTGDIEHSLAEISKAQVLLGYQPAYTITQGMAETLEWYVKQFNARAKGG